MSHSKINLPLEIIQEIINFLPIHDMNDMRIFLLSKHFMTLLLSSSSTTTIGNNLKNNNNHHHDDDENHNSSVGNDSNCAIFYKILSETLLRQHLKIVIERILARNLFFTAVGDYNEKENCVNESFQLPPGNTSIAEENYLAYTNHGQASDYETRAFRKRTKLSVEPCGRSNAQLRRELKKLVEFSLLYFPHVYKEYNQRIEMALKKSIKGCLDVENKPIRNQPPLPPYQSSSPTTNPPKIWDLERREKSIEIKHQRSNKDTTTTKRPKGLPVAVQWKTLFKHQYHEFLLSELQFYRKYMASHFLTTKYPARIFGKGAERPIEPLLDSMEHILELLKRLGHHHRYSKEKDFNFFIKKITIISEQRPQKVNMNFLDSILITLTQFLKYRFMEELNEESLGSEVIYNRCVKIIDQCMAWYELYYPNLVEIYPETSIYHYIIKLRSNELLERYLTPKVIEKIQDNPLFHNQFLLSCLTNIDNPPEFIIATLRKLTLSIKFTENGYEKSISDELVIGYSIYRDAFNSRKWIEILLELFGKEQLLANFTTIESFQHVPDIHKVVIQEVLGDEFMKLYEVAINDRKNAVYPVLPSGGDWTNWDDESFDQHW